MNKICKNIKKFIGKYVPVKVAVIAVASLSLFSMTVYGDPGGSGGSPRMAVNAVIVLECDKEMQKGPSGKETLILSVGETASCMLELTGGNENQEITNLLIGNGDVINIVSDKEPVDGELLIEIEGEETGLVWTAWEVEIDNAKSERLNRRFSISNVEEADTLGLFVVVVNEHSGRRIRISTPSRGGD